MIRSVVAIATTALLLTSCFTGQDAFDQVFVIDPVVTVSATEAAIGEFVEVHVSSSFYVLKRSRVQTFTADVQLGICLLPDWLANDDGVTSNADNCNPVEAFGTDAYFQPTTDFTLAPGDAAAVTIPTTIERGQAIDIEHTFSIAAERAGTVKLLGMLYAHSDQNVRPWGMSACVAECGFVTWE